MEYDLARKNRKTMERLRTQGDRESVERAFLHGKITEQQAKNLLKLITAVAQVKAHPLPVLVQSETGRILGKVHPSGEGKSWEARPYGKNYPAGEMLGSQEEAVEYVMHAAAEKASERAFGHCLGIGRSLKS